MLPARIPLNANLSRLPLVALSVRHAVWRQHSQHVRQRDHRASTKLWQDAHDEEAEIAEQTARHKRVMARVHHHENWTGDERMHDAVLRMLVDKYKPLRSGPIRTADEKLKHKPPRVGSPHPIRVHTEAHAEPHHVEVRATWGSSGPSLANVPLLPSIEGHKPWDTTFTVPSFAQSSIKYGNIPITSPTPPSPPPASALDDKARIKDREAKRRAQLATKLHNARESTLDYKLGLKDGKSEEVQKLRVPMPATMAGWTTLVEARIEEARREGLFDDVPGRGKPMVVTPEERNPFIDPVEFLLNRIVQRQGAAPAWIELQGELEEAVHTFRSVVRHSWTRRTIRMLTSTRSLAELSTLTLDDIIALRDTEWEARERAYHDTALEEINALTRKYNGLAPYTVRRAYYTLEYELERARKDSGKDILRTIAERVAAPPPPVSGITDADGEDGVAVNGSSDIGGQGVEPLPPMRIREVIREWVTMVFGKEKEKEKAASRS